MKDDINAYTLTLEWKDEESNLVIGHKIVISDRLDKQQIKEYLVKLASNIEYNRCKQIEQIEKIIENTNGK